MKKRRKARSVALQRLYAYEVSGNRLEKVIDEIFEDCGDDTEIAAFAVMLLKRSVEKREEIDAEVSRMVQNWDFSRVALVDRLIIRMAFCELLYFDEIPPKVTINEAIELAKSFSTEQSGRFVNGILDSLYKKFKSERKIVKTGRGLIE
ncbi:transcription antitermination factor NusB [bacterium]|nr:transcription antitermination factor NusB [bacterium]